MSNRWNWLRDRLIELKSNPSRFAKDLDWPASRVYELFSGKTKAIPLDRVAKAAALLGIRLDDMLNFNSGLSDNIRFSITPTTNYVEATSNIPELDMYNICSEIQTNEWDENENFLNDVSYEQLKAAIDNKDCEAAFKAAHTLKGVAGNLSMKKLAKTVSDMTEEFRAGNFDAGLVYVDEMDSQYKAMIAFISQL